VGIRSSFPGGKVTDHSPPFSAVVKVSGAIPPLLNTPSWRVAQLKEAQGQLYLYLTFMEYLLCVCSSVAAGRRLKH